MSTVQHALQFRPALADEIPLLAEFQLAMARETEQLRLDPATVSAGVSAVFARPELGRYYVAHGGDGVLGALLITFEWSDWRNGTVWWIQSVYVAPHARQRGVYAGLYRHIQELAAADPTVRGIRLYVDKRNRRAQEVYGRLGMNGEHYQVFEWLADGEGTGD